MRFESSSSNETPTLTATGYLTGYPGIWLPEAATLTVEGKGAIVAKGVNAGYRESGSNANTNTYGSGGDGAKGAGAGIGSDGGYGGGPGRTGGASLETGTLIQRGDVSITAIAGNTITNSASGGYQGGYEGSYTKKGPYCKLQVYGGGGGAGGTGGNAAAIGSGGSGGGGGGDGGTSDYKAGKYNSIVISVTGGGGGAGRVGGMGGQGVTIQQKYEETYRTGYYSPYGGGAKNLNGGSVTGTARSGGSAQRSGKAGSVFTVNEISATTKATPESYYVDGNSSPINVAYPIDECKITVDESDSATFGPDGEAFKYTSKAVEPKVTIVHVPTGKIVPVSAYNVEYSNNVEPGQAKVKISGSGGSTNLVNSKNASATFEGDFDIKYDFADFDVVYTDYLTCNVTKGETNPVDVVTSSTALNAAYKYTGSAINEGKLALKSDNSVLIDIENYDRTCTNNVAVTNSAKTEIVVRQGSEKWFEDSWGKTAIGTFSIMSSPVITTESKTYLDAYPNTPYELQLEVSNPNGAPYDELYWKIDSGALPLGLSLDERTGLISGTPDDDIKDAVASIHVYNLAGWSNSVACTWKVAAIQGKATTTSGTPCSNVAVKVLDKETQTLTLGEATTDKNGSYNIPTIPNRPRDVVIQFSTASDLSGRPQRVVNGEESKTINVPDSNESVKCNVVIEQATKLTFTVQEHASFSGEASSVSQYGFAGDALNLPGFASIDKGWKLVSWKDATDSEPATVYPGKDNTYVAQLEEGTYTVKYDAAGGSKTSLEAYDDWSGKFEAGASEDPTKCILPYQNPIRLGYKFVNWHLLGNENLVITKDTTYEELVSGNETIMSTTVVAKWEVRDDIKVTLDSNGTSGAPAKIGTQDQVVFENKTTGAVLDYAAPTRSGYTFKGWSLKKLASEAIGDYSPIMSLTVPGLREEESEVTFYAIWQANNIGVEFNMMEGTSSSDDISFSGNPGESYTVPANPTRTGYKFKGWYTSPTKSSDAYVAKNLGTLPSESTTYYAQWEASKVNVTLIANDGAVPAKQTFSGEYENGVIYTHPERAGYTFVGWKAQGDSDDNAQYFLNFPEKDSTYVAVFEAEMVRVAYDTNGGSFDSTDESGIRKGAVGSTYTPPADPTREGYNFKGWKLTLDGTKAAPSEATIPAYSKTYYAYWEKKEITITLNSSDASNVQTQQCKGLFKEAVEYTLPVRDGWAFKGWKKVGDVDANATLSFVYPSQDATYEACWVEGESAIRFNACGGKWDDSLGESGERVGAKGTAYDAPQDPARSGYTFKGWYTDLGEDETEVTEYVFPDASNTTYYAKWEANEVTVTLDAGVGANPQTQELKGKSGSAITGITTPAKEGYTFSGWKTTSSDASATFTLTYPTEDAIYTALWTENDVKVTLNANGGKFADQDSEDELTFDGYKGASYADKIKEPTRSGYDFNGWWTLPVGGTQHTQDTGLGTYPVSSTIYYAQWKEKEVTVTLRSGEGSSTADQAISGKFGATIDEYSIPKKDGYAFIGWKLEGTEDNTAVSFFTFPEVDKTYDAVWEAGVSVVTFNTMGGIFTTANESALRKGSTNSEYAAPTNPKRAGYVFQGWYTARTGGEKKEFVDGKATFSSDPNIVYFAHWTLLQTSAKLMMNDGSEAVHQTLKGDALTSVPYTLPKRAGYTFVGWNTDASASAGDFSLLFPAMSEDDTQETTYYAIWSAYDNTVVYDAQGGEWKTSETGIRIGKTGSAMTQASSPQKTGYTFDGWFTEPQGGIEAPVLTSIPTESVRYYAHWTIAKHNVTLFANSGSFASSTQLTYNGEYNTEVSYEIPVKQGYIFAGWNESGNSDDPHPTSIKYQDIDIELKAVWQAATTSIAFDANGGTIIEGTTDTGDSSKAYEGTVDASVQEQLPSATRKGYDFSGWYTAPSAGTKIDSMPATYPNKDVKYYAQWQPSTIKVYLDLAGGNVEGATDIQTLQGKYGELVSYAIPARVGYVFAGYKLSGAEDSTATLNLTYPDESDKTFQALWVLDTSLTVSFNTMGGTYSGDAPQTVFTPTSDADASFVAPAAPTRDGYTFKGWSLDPSKTDADTTTGDVGAGAIVKYPSKSVTYYAIWAVQELGITLDANGGSYSDNTTSKTLSGPYGTSANYEAPSRHNYSFAGWLINDTDVTYDIQFSSENEGKTMKAIWSAGSASVTFICVGVDSASASKHFTGEVGEEFTVPANPVRTGYKFSGWFTKDGKKLDSNAGDTLRFDDNIEHVYYAKWSENPTSIKLHYNFGDPEKTVDKAGLEGELVDVTTPVRTGYVFNGWSTKQDATRGETKLKFPEASSDNSVIDYYATWKVESHNVYFDTKGGKFSDDSIMKEVSGNAGEVYDIPESPTREGYEFTGWYEMADGTGTQLDETPTIPMTADEQWYAGWQKVSGTLTLDANEGIFADESTEPVINIAANDLDADDGDDEEVIEESKTVKEVSANFGDNVEYKVPTRESYAFIGWVKDKDSEDETPIFTIQMNTDSSGQTYYAKWLPNSASVTFVATEADNAENANVICQGEYGETFTVPANPVKAGYSFDGWFTSLTGGEKLDKVAGDEMTFSELEPSVYYARFSKSESQVTLDANGGTIDDQESMFVSGNTDDVISYTVPTRNGYTFVGWNKSGDATSTNDTPATSLTFPATSQTYKACWTANVAKVKFIALNANVVENGQSKGKSSAEYTGKTDLTVTYGAMSATRVGYTFVGWSEMQIGDVVDALPSTFEPGVSVYYAQFVANDVHITLDGNGGSFAGIDPLQLTGKYDDNAVLERPTREGYTFVGWADRADAKASDAKTGLTYGYGLATDGATIYAIWEANNIVVKYNSGRGQFADGTNEVEVSGGAETTYTIPDAPTRTGYDFKGWFTLPNGEGSDVSEVNTFPALKNAIYYAKWEKKTYEVTLNANGGSFGDSDTQVASGIFEEPIAYSVPSNHGYAFLGWSENKDASKDDADLHLTYSDDTKDKTFYAIWDPNSKGVVFIADGEDSHTSETITGKIGDQFEVPSDPTRAGFIFEGWYTEHNGGEKLEASAGDKLTFTKDTPVAYYAHFSENKTDVTLHYNTGNASDDETVAGLENEQIAYKEVKRAGYTFKGWASSEDAVQADLGMRPTYPSKPEDGSAIDLYAIWSADEVTITFSAQGGIFNDNKELRLITSETDADYDLPSDPTRTGFIFAGWYTSTNGQGDRIDESSKAPSSNKVYFAKWEGETVELALDPNGGHFQQDEAALMSANALNVTKSGEYLAPVEYDIPLRDGYTFIGWNSSGNANDEDDPAKMSITYPSEFTTYKACWRANDAKVMFIASHGDVVDNGASSGKVSVEYLGKTDGDVNYGEMTATRTGYEFEGWSTSPDGEVVESLPATFKSGVHVYYAQFTSNDITVTLNANGGAFSGDVDPLLIKGKYDDKVVYETPTREGYSFVGWEGASDGEAQSAKTEMTYGYDLAIDGGEVFAIWQPNNISVKYQAAGGTFADGSIEKELNGDAESTYTIPESPARTGYKFAGWFTSPNGAGTDATNVDKFPTVKNIVYYAKWEKAEYELTLDANGGSFDSDTTTSMKGNFEDNVEYVVPTRSGYAFVGWSQDSNATKDDAKLQLNYNEGSKDKTYYAIWEPAAKGVAFVAIGSPSEDSKSLTGKVGDEFEVPADPTRTGYIFDGWYTEINGGFKLNASAGSRLKFAFDTPTAYYAHFKENKTDVVLHYNDGGATDDVTVSGIENTTVHYSEVKRAGYTFMGWASSSDSENADLGMQPTFPAKPESGSVDFYAVWKADGVTLTFSAQGGYFEDGKEVQTINAKTDSIYDLPTPPTRTGYTFAGWFTSTNGQGGQIAENATAPSSNAVYFAKWVGKQISLHLDPNGGKFASSASEDATLQSSAVTITGEYLDVAEYSIPSRAGYTFLGWNRAGDESENTLLTLTIPDEETTLKAVWQAHDIKIAYVATDAKINGKDNSEEVIYSGKTDQDIDFAIPTATKEGYDFVGWTLEAGSEKIAEDPSVYPTSDATYYASFRKDKVTLKFDANGGTIGNATSSVQTEQYGYIVNYETPKRDGYYFTGWSTTKNGSAGKNFNYTYGKGDAQSGSTLYAQWEAFPADLTGEVQRVTEELAIAKAAGDDNAIKAAAAEAEALKLRDENGNLITLANNSGATTDAASLSGSGDSIGGDTNASSVTGDTSNQPGKEKGKSKLLSLLTGGSIYTVLLWILLLVGFCAGLLFAIKRRRENEEEEETNAQS